MPSEDISGIGLHTRDGRCVTHSVITAP
jgi:hypothetical protein